MPVEIIECADDLATIATEWNSLAERFGNPLLRYEWFNACAHASSPTGTLSIIVIRSHGEIRAIAPLVLVKRGSVSTLQFLGDAFCVLGEPCGLIYKDEQSLQELIAAMVSQRRPLRLNRIPADSSEAIALSRARQGVTTVSPRNSS